MRVVARLQTLLRGRRTPGLLARSLPALGCLVFACEWLAAHTIHVEPGLRMRTGR